MKPRLWTLLLVSHFTLLGNGQDGALSPTIVRGDSGPRVQGSVGWTQAQNEAELASAALVARQKKALMGAMASLSQKPPVITSAEQYLQVNRPAMPRSSVGSAPAPQTARSDHDVPAFKAGGTAVAGEEGTSATSPAPSVGLPGKKTGLFALFQSKEDGTSGGLLRNPELSDEPSAAGGDIEPPAASPDPASETTSTQAAVTNEAAVTLDSPMERPPFFGRLFGKSKVSESFPISDPSGSTPPVVAGLNPPLPTAAPVSNDVLAPTLAVAPAPMARGSDGGSSIFLKRPPSLDSGARATVLTTSQATVSGVLVRLYEGSSVSVLERSGSMARIRLADGREGTVAASALSR